MGKEAAPRGCRWGRRRRCEGLDGDGGGAAREECRGSHVEEHEGNMCNKEY